MKPIVIGYHCGPLIGDNLRNDNADGRTYSESFSLWDRSHSKHTPTYLWALGRYTSKLSFMFNTVARQPPEIYEWFAIFGTQNAIDGVRNNCSKGKQLFLMNYFCEMSSDLKLHANRGILDCKTLRAERHRLLAKVLLIRGHHYLWRWHGDEYDSISIYLLACCEVVIMLLQFLGVQKTKTYSRWEIKWLTRCSTFVTTQYGWALTAQVVLFDKKNDPG